MSGAAAVVIYVNGSCPEHNSDRVGHLRSPLSGHLSVVRTPEVAPVDAPARSESSRPRARLDPAAVHREFPERWAAYIRASFRDYRAVTQAFNVCERTARKWWDGETGANGGHVAVAVRSDANAAQMLFAAE